MNKKVDIYALIDQMTLKEKIGQLGQLIAFLYKSNTQGDITGPLEELGIGEENLWINGSVLGTGNAKDAIEIQKKYLEHNRLGIPLVFMADIIHGYKTIFPIPLAIGATWNIEAAYKMARVSAIEAAVSGIHVTFAPMVDLVRDARWGRVLESTGEDAYLNSCMAKAMVEGYQGNFDDPYNIGACVKHFAAYGAAEAGREYNTVDLSDRTLREYYLPSYKAAVEAGAKLVMTSFNTVHGVPSTGNKYLLKDILRDEWNFDGVIISDWAAVGELITHGVAEDGKQAAESAMHATLDMEMMTSHYVHYLEELIQEGRVDEQQVNDAVYRILKLKEDLGLFENPYKMANVGEEAKLLFSDEHREVAREVARESIVLLKNEDVLPLSKNKKVGIIGPLGNTGELLGAWSWQGDRKATVSVLEGIKAKVGAVQYAKGCDVIDDTINEEEVLKVIDESDVIILAVGESEDMAGEAGSRTVIKLPGVQEALVKLVKQAGKPVVTVMFSGRPLEIKEVSENSHALLSAWYPGSEAGNALADILYGDYNPSARLTMSFPYTVGQAPIYYNHYNTGRPKPKDEGRMGYCSEYIDSPNAPLYSFGYGLSYTHYTYEEMNIDKEKLVEGECIKASVKIKNVGKVAGKETVQLYIRDWVGSTVRPVKELKGFKQIYLNPDEEIRVEFDITEEMLKYNTLKNGFDSESGKFSIIIGPNSQEGLEKTFELIK
ncbi:glycoside hydrolase family 3 N-terminal domain-containing protein [Niameybacter massiliensis]|uniref:glycoside hydrolase family 3 N-terminal domain-containing protein n=1 Tax=Niameybacter massiliensis TaxID=1658108 RepID=UPI0006B53079|nr:glycoside hydrolase family 3 N-terminal domain-containing protein [Niameybacter massiliensis]